MAIAGTLEIQMLANMARLQADMDTAKRSVGTAMSNIESSVASAKNALAGLGVGISIGYFVSLIKGSIDAADHLKDLSKANNIAVGDLAGLQLLARQTGTDLDGLAKGINKMSVEMGKDPEKFRALGVTAKDNTGALKQFADIFNLLPGINQRNALSQAVFSKSWSELAPALSEGSKGIGEAIEKGKALSTITTEITNGSDAFNDKWAQLTGTGGAMNGVLSGLLPVLNKLADDLINVQEKGDGAAKIFPKIGEAIGTGLVFIKDATVFLYEHKTAVEAAAGAYLSWKLGTFAADMAKSAVTTYTQVTASMAAKAALLETATAAAQATGATLVLTTARVAELRAAASAAEGEVALAIATNGLIPAQTRAAAAALAHADAVAALAVAQKAASVTASATGSAIGLLGGPIGILITVIGLAATAWAVFGEKGKSAIDGINDEIVKGIAIAQRYKKEALFGTGDVGQLNIALDAVNKKIEVLGQSKGEGAAKLLKEARDQAEKLQAALKQSAPTVASGPTAAQIAASDAAKAFMAKGSGGADKAAQEAYKAQIEAFNGQQKQEQANLQQHLYTLDTLHKNALMGDTEFENKRYAATVANMEKLRALDEQKMSAAKGAGQVKDVAKYVADIKVINNQILLEEQKHNDNLFTVDKRSQDQITSNSITAMKARGDIVGAFQAEYTKKNSDEILRATRDNNQELIDSIEADYKAGLSSANFEQNRAQFAALTSEMQAGLDKVRQAAQLDGGLPAWINAQAASEKITNEALPKLRELQQAMLDAANASGNQSEKKVAIDLSTGIDDQAIKMQTAAADTANAWQKAGDDIAKSLTGAFGSAGSSMGNVLKSYTNFKANQTKLDAAYAAKADQYGQHTAKQAQQYQDQTTQNTVGSYGDMAGAAAEFFEKGSDGYEALKMAEQVFRGVQLAMSIAAMVQDTTETGASIGNSLARGAADLFAGVMKMFAQSGWGGFVGAAALIALAVSLGGSGGGGGGGGTASGGAAADGTGGGAGYDGYSGINRHGQYDDQKQLNKTDYSDDVKIQQANDAATALNDLNRSMRTLKAGATALEQDLIDVRIAAQGAGKAQHEMATRGLSEAEVKAYNYNAALENQITVLMDVANGTNFASKNAKSLADETTKLSIELMEASGDIAGARALQRDVDTMGYTAGELASYDHNASLQAQIDAMSAGSSAANDAAQAENDLAQKRYELSNVIKVMMGQQTQLEADRAAELAEVTDTSVSALINLRNALEDIDSNIAKLIGNADAAFARLGRSVKVERDAANIVLKASTDLANSLKSSLGSMNLDGSRANAQAQVAMFLAIAKASGVLPSAADIQPALKAIAKPSEQLFGTFEDYQHDFARTASDIADLSKLAEGQVTEAQQQIDALDAIMVTAQSQLDKLNDIDTSVISVAGAVEGMAAAFGAAQAARDGADAARAAASAGVNTNYTAPTGGGGGGGGYGGGYGGSAAAEYESIAGQTNRDIVAAYRAYYKRNPDAGGYETYSHIGLAGDALMQAILGGSAGNPEGADFMMARSRGYDPMNPSANFLRSQLNPTGGGSVAQPGYDSYAIGSNYIPDDQIAQIHKGEEITPRPYVDMQRASRDETNALMRRLVQSNEELRKEVVSLRASTERGNENTQRAADTLSGRQGVPFLVQVAA